MQPFTIARLPHALLVLAVASTLTACNDDDDPTVLATGEPIPPGTTVDLSQAYERVVVQNSAPTEQDFFQDNDLGVFLTDQTDLTLYVFGNDSPGTSVCNISEESQCANVWPPLFAPENAQDQGEYSVVTRADGSRQWAYRGYPLYFFNGNANKPADARAGDTNGFLVGNIWFVVRPDPFRKSTTSEVSEDLWVGQGEILNFGVSDNMVAVTEPFSEIDSGQRRSVEGLTLYTFDKDPGDDTSVCNGDPCAINWPPLYADFFSLPPSASFTIIQRDNGTSQWAYQGKPLYFWHQDAEPGDILGAEVPNWTLAFRAAEDL